MIQPNDLLGWCSDCEARVHGEDAIYPPDNIVQCPDCGKEQNASLDLLHIPTSGYAVYSADDLIEVYNDLFDANFWVDIYSAQGISNLAIIDLTIGSPVIDSLEVPAEQEVSHE